MWFDICCIFWLNFLVYTLTCVMQPYQLISAWYGSSATAMCLIYACNSYIFIHFCVKIIICQSFTLSDNFSTNWILSCNQIRWKRPNSLITLSCHYFLFIFDEKITHWRGTATSNIIFSFLIDTSQLRSYLRNILTPQFITPFPTNRYVLNFIFSLE